MRRAVSFRGSKRRIAEIEREHPHAGWRMLFVLLLFGMLVTLMLALGTGRL